MKNRFPCDDVHRPKVKKCPTRRAIEEYNKFLKDKKDDNRGANVAK
jgi:hypothetical protein